MDQEIFHLPQEIPSVAMISPCSISIEDGERCDGVLFFTVECGRKSSCDTKFGQLETAASNVNRKQSEEASTFDGFILPCEPPCKHLEFLPDADEDDATGLENHPRECGPTHPWRQGLKRKRGLSEESENSRKRQKLV